MKIESSLTVFFEDPFWVGVLECRQQGALTACRVVFGSEPRDCEIYALFLEGWNRLRFSPPVADERRGRAENPKRTQRQIARRLQERGAGTKAQQALALQREAQAAVRKTAARQRVREERDRLYELGRQKRKEKHRGR